MIDWRRTGRQALVVAFACTVSGLVLRPALSSALVSRGDALTFQGQTRHALAVYSRAIALDGNDAVALDRYLFSALLVHDDGALREAVAAGERYMRRHPQALSVEFDVALDEQRLHRYGAAAAHFEATGSRTHDPAAFVFAALDVAASQPARAIRLLHAALRMDPAFAPARRDLTILARGRRWKR